MPYYLSFDYAYKKNMNGPKARRSFRVHYIRQSQNLQFCNISIAEVQLKTSLTPGIFNSKKRGGGRGHKERENLPFSQQLLEQLPTIGPPTREWLPSHLYEGVQALLVLLRNPPTTGAWNVVQLPREQLQPTHASNDQGQPPDVAFGRHARRLWGYPSRISRAARAGCGGCGIDGPACL